jgi:hypothetical protein
MIGFRAILAAAGRGLAQAAAVTWNPDDTNAKITLSNGNLTAVGNGESNLVTRATASRSSGKWYFEVKVDAKSASPMNGVATAQHSLSDWLGVSSYSWSLMYDGRKVHASSWSSYHSDPATGVVGIAVDLDVGHIWFSVNGFFLGDPAAGTDAAFTNLPVGTPIFPAMSLASSGQGTARFTAADQSYSPPAGFSPWES